MGVEKVKIYETDKERILKLRKSGLSFANIGRRYSCSASAVLRRFRKWTSEDKKELFEKRVAAKVAQVNRYVIGREANEENLRRYLKALFQIEDEEKKKKPIQVKKVEVEDSGSWSGGSIEDDLDGVLKLEGEGGLLGRQKKKIYKSTEAEKKAYLEREKYYKDSS